MPYKTQASRGLYGRSLTRAREEEMNGRNGRFIALTLACAAGLISCAGGEGGAGVTVRDSAGVQIVESRGSAGVGPSGWSLGAAPLLAIGVDEGAVEYQFSQVEGALRLPDGRFAVSDGGSREIRFFDVDGRFLSSSGRRGDAPGEYQMIYAMGYGPGDSIWVFDYGNRRFTVLTDDGELARTLTLGTTLANVAAVGRSADGSFVVKELWSAGGAQGGAIQLGLIRDPVAVARFATAGGRPDTIGLVPGREIFAWTENGRAVMSTPLFAHSVSAVVHGDAVFVGDQATFEIGVYSAAGALRRLIRLPDVDLRLTADDIARATEDRLAGTPEARRIMARRQLESMELPENQPAYGPLLVDADGNLWAGSYAAYPKPPASWRVFAPDGRAIGSLRMPERFRPFQIGSDWVLGVGRDEFDVEYVHLYELIKHE